MLNPVLCVTLDGARWADTNIDGFLWWMLLGVWLALRKALELTTTLRIVEKESEDLDEVGPMFILYTLYFLSFFVARLRLLYRVSTKKKRRALS